MLPFVVLRDVELLNAKVVPATMNLVGATVERNPKEMLMSDWVNQASEVEQQQSNILCHDFHTKSTNQNNLHSFIPEVWRDNKSGQQSGAYSYSVQWVVYSWSNNDTRYTRFHRELSSHWSQGFHWQVEENQPDDEVEISFVKHRFTVYNRSTISCESHVCALLNSCLWLQSDRGYKWRHSIRHHSGKLFVSEGFDQPPPWLAWVRSSYCHC